MISYHKLKEIIFEPEFNNVLYLFTVSVKNSDAQFAVRLVKPILHATNILDRGIRKELEKSSNF